MKLILRLLVPVLCFVLLISLEAKSDSLLKPKPPKKPAKTYAPVELPHKIQKSRGAVPQREWTILYYLDADNDLEPYMLNDVDEMEVIGSTDNINLVAMLDRHPGYEPRDGNWTNNKLLYITRDND